MRIGTCLGFATRPLLLYIIGGGLARNWYQGMARKVNIYNNWPLRIKHKSLLEEEIKAIIYLTHKAFCGKLITHRRQ